MANNNQSHINLLSMKKLYFLLAIALMSFHANAQILLDEDFETASTNTYSTPIANGSGWTTVNSYNGSTMKYNWTNYYNEKGTLSGKHVASCDGAMFPSDAAGHGPREEILISPELNLDNTYQLSFDWKVSPMAFQSKTLYDLQVRIVENNDIKNAETIFSIHNEEDLRASGVLVYPITNWDPFTSQIDLSEWQGKRIKIAFVYKMLTTEANVVFLDNVKVKQYTPPTQPIPEVSLNRYDFGQVYVGEKFYSEKIKLTNKGLNGLKILSVDLPQGVVMTIDPATVNLNKYENVEFQFSYKASLTSPSTGSAVLHTNGGDVTIALIANKTVVPQGMTEETFEQFFPPAGWANKGWEWNGFALEGDHTAYATASMTDIYLTSPRLDLSHGGKLIFEYYNQFTSNDGGTYQNNDVSIELSTDGGVTWQQKWLFDYTKGDYREMVTVDLGTGTNNSFVRWKNTAVKYDSETGVEEFSNFYLDRVFLPNVYGANGLPGISGLIAPADSLKDVYGKDIILKWSPAQFATGYKVYVGTTEAATELVNAQDVGNTLTYTIPTTDYETFYYWKIVPYNTMGNAQNVPIWHFTTQKDASTGNYPYTEDFSSARFPDGWSSEPSPTYNRKWTINEFGGNAKPCLYSSWLATGERSSVTTQEFKLPEGKAMEISFDWSDGHPTSILKDETGIAKKKNVSPNNGISKIGFDIYVDGQWNELAYISQEGETRYWINETVNLAAYAGKTVQFRWTHYGFNSNKDHGGAIDNIVIEEVMADKATFNKPEWNAGKVNCNMALNSGEQFTLINKGTSNLKIKSAAFATQNFSTTLLAGDEIPSGSGKQFSLQFNAHESNAEVIDALSVEFESGLKVSLPVKGHALARDAFYYSFEKNPLDRNWESDFTMIDADQAISYAFGTWWIKFDKSGQPFAFAVGYDSQMNGIMSPVSGDAALVAASPAAATGVSQANNWIISRQLTAQNGASFSFYARNWESNQSVVPAPKHQVTVLVSETSNTDMSTFTEVLPKQEIPFLDGNNWQHYTVDLSAYAGKNIYVALRHSTDQTSNVAFFDDFMLEHFIPSPTGITNVETIADDAELTVYTPAGTMIRRSTGRATLKSLPKGIYIIKVNQAGKTTTLRITQR